MRDIGRHTNKYNIGNGGSRQESIGRDTSMPRKIRKEISKANPISGFEIPKSVFAISGMLTNFVLSFISLLALIPFIIYYGIDVNLTILLVPFCLILLGLSGTGIGLMIAPYAVRIPDLVNIVQFIARVGFFLSPVMWTYPMLSNKFGTGDYLVIAHLNPVIVPITVMRDLILGGSSGIPDYGYWMFAVIAISTFILGTMIFIKKAHKMVVGL